MSEARGPSIARENTRLALDAIRSHRLRSALVILGVAIGVASLMTMVAILSGLGHVIQRDLSSKDRVIVYISKWDFLSGSADEKVLGRPDVEPADAPAVGRLSPAVDIADYYIEPTGFRLHRASYRGHRTRPLSVVGCGVHFHRFYPLEIAEGRAFTETDVERRRRVCMLGYGPVRDLFPDVDPIGKHVRIGNHRYEVVGTYSERKSIAGSMGENYVVLPYTTYIKDWKRRSDMGYVMVTVAEGYASDDVVSQARSIMRQRRGLRPRDDDDFAVITADAVEELVQRVTGPIALVLLIVSSIGLMVGGIGVMNIMLVSVTERTREIGIRKAVGARRRDILGQILVEAGTLTGMGGVVGLAIGGLAAWLLKVLVGFPVRVDLLVVIGAVLFSVSIGILFGLYPANRAARLATVDALRYE